MPRSIFLFLILFISLTVSTQGQSVVSGAEVDSLKKRLVKSGESERIDLLNQLAFHYAPINFDSSIYFSTRAMRLSIQYGFELQTGRARYIAGNAYYYKMDFKNALISYLAALKILEKNKSMKEAGDVYLYLGHINFFIKRTDKAIAYYHKALKNFILAGNEHACAEVDEAMSGMMDNLGYEPVDSALWYSHKLLEYSRKFNYHYREAFALMMIGQICIDEKLSGKYDQYAIAYNDSAMKIAAKYNFQDLISIINLNLGCFYYINRNCLPTKSPTDHFMTRSYLDKSIAAAQKWGSSNMLALCYNNLAWVCIEEKKYEEAERLLDQCEICLNNYFSYDRKKNDQVRIGYSFSKIIDFFLAQRTQNLLYEARYSLALAKGELRKAIEYLQLYYQSRDTLNAAQQSRQFELIMAEAEAEITEQKIRTLSQNNELNQLRLSRTRLMFAGAGATVVIISLFLLLFFQRKRLKAEQISVTMEQRLLRAQMNPHFLFNSLASIQNYIINEKTDEASLYLSRFSQLVRNVLDNSAEEFVSLENEVDAIQNYLELQKVRYAGKFDFQLIVDDKIDPEFIFIPPMLAQPFIENSIEHGIKHLETKGYIDIRFMLDDRLIRFEVEDNGVGREKAGIIEHRQNSRHRSISTSITQERLLAIGQKMKKKIKLEIIDMRDNDGNACGTRVTFRTPFVSNQLK